MAELLGWMFFGLVTAKLAMPQSGMKALGIAIPMSIAGAIAGGWLGSEFGAGFPAEAVGWVASIAASTVVVAIYRFYSGGGPEALA